LKALLRHWLSSKPSLSQQQAARLSAWRALPPAGRNEHFKHTRCVVVDVETTGLNLMTDTLISIGAVGVVNGRIALGDSFYAVLQQRNSSTRENILVHGISGSVQREGESPADALLAFLEYLCGDPLIAFHVTFDETMIRRAVKQYLGISFKHPWLDLAYVMPALFPELMHSHRALDDWAQNFEIRNDDRHNAAADALVTAQLLLIAISAARKYGDAGYDGLRSLERTYRYASGKL
jgi:DNA polymerase III subunit epsilon